METFGAILKRLRESKGMTQEDLSAAMAEKGTPISRVHIARLEKDSRAPLWATVQALAAALGVKCEAFEDAPAEEPNKPAPKSKPKKRRG